MELIKKSTDPNSEYFKINKEYSEVIHNITRERQFNNFIGGLPITLERKDVFSLMSKDIKGNYRYSVTQKADGIRVLLFAHYKSSNGERKICFVDRKNNFYNLTTTAREELPTFKGPKMLIDGELIIYDTNNETVTDMSKKYYNIKSYSFMAFDILYGPIEIDYSGSFDEKKLNIGSEGAMAGPIGGKKWTYTNRYDILYLLIVPHELNDFRPILSLSFINCSWFVPEVKQIYSIGALNRKQELYSNRGFFQKNLVEYRTNFYNLINELRNKKAQYIPIQLDGLIFTPFDTEYVIGGAWKKFLNIQYKWKPVEEQSIDFFIDYSKNNVILKVKAGDNYIPFTIKRDVPYPSEPFKKVKPGVIGEFIYNVNKFQLKNLRTDKTEPNSISTAINVLNSIKKPVNIEIIKMFFIINKLNENGLKQLMQYSSKNQLLTCAINNNKLKIISDQIKTKIEHNLKLFKQNSDYEYEIRLGYIENSRYQTNLSFNLYKKIIDILSINKIEFTYTPFIDLYKNDIRSRYIYLNKTIKPKIIGNVIKKSIENININTNFLYNFDLRFALSEEKNTREEVKEDNYDLKLEKNRYSFNLGIIQIDCTEIRKYDSNLSKFGSSNYQVEIEIIDRKANYSDILNILTKFLSLVN